MALRDKFKRQPSGEPARARVVVNRFPGVETGQSSLRTTASMRLQVLPDGAEQDFRGLVPTIHAELITAGMEIPVLVDDAQVVGLGEPMDEAIGSYFMALEPESFPSWKDAYDAKVKQVRRTTGIFGDMHHLVDQAKDAAATAKELPAYVRDAKSDWSSALGEMAADFKADGPAQAEAAVRARDIRATGTPVATVISRVPTGETQSGAPVYTLVLEIAQDGATRQITHTEALNETWPPSLQPGQSDTVYLDPRDNNRVVLGILHGVNA